MLAVLLFALQETASAPVSGPVLPSKPSPTLSPFRKPCRPGDTADEVTVCGSRSADERYRLKPLPDRYQEKPLRAATTLGDGATAEIAAEQKDLGSGFVSKRMMLNFKFVLGGKKKKKS